MSEFFCLAHFSKLYTLYSKKFYYLAKAILLLFFLYPFLWLLLASFWPDYEPLSSVWTLSKITSSTLDNYYTAITLVPMGNFAFNSVRVVIIAVPLSVLTASLAAFAMYCLPLVWQRGLLWLSLLALLTPPTALWLARFPIFKMLGWINTPWPLIAPAFFGGSPFFVLIFFWSFKRLAPELFEAALLEGASVWYLWWKIALPQCYNVVVGVVVLNFVLFWGNFTDPLLYLRSESEMTLPVGVRLLAQLDITRWPVIIAGSVLLTLPVVGLFLIAHYFLWPAFRNKFSL